MYIPAESVNIIGRGLFSHSKSNHTCPVTQDPNATHEPVVGSMMFHTLATIICGACAIVSLLVSLILIMRHATNYTSPVQQRQIMRIVFLIPWIAIVCFLCVWLESAALYLLPAQDTGSAIALIAFLLFLCDCILTNPDGFDELFGKGALARGQFDMRSPPMLKRVWYCVLQFFPVSIIIWIAQAAAQANGTYCAESNKPYFAHIWIQIVKLLSTGLAVVSILRFYKAKKAMLAPHKIMLKLIAFKGVIFINVLQTTIINLLISGGTIKPTKYLTVKDIQILPELILGCEMPIFAFFLFYAYRVTPYAHTKAVGQGGPGGIKAILNALNYSDILSAFFRGPMRLVRGQAQARSFGSRSDDVQLMATPPPYHPQQQTGYTGYAAQGYQGVPNGRYQGA